MNNLVTANDVHFTIQEMNGGVSVDNKSIPLNTIANTLQLNNDELLIHINTLRALYYLKYTDRNKENICLTFNGMNTVVPH